jgi:hypothetical protein
MSPVGVDAFPAVQAVCGTDQVEHGQRFEVDAAGIK